MKGESVVLTEKHPDQGEGSAGLTTEPRPPLASTRERGQPHSTTTTTTTPCHRHSASVHPNSTITAVAFVCPCDCNYSFYPYPYTLHWYSLTATRLRLHRVTPTVARTREECSGTCLIDTAAHALPTVAVSSQPHRERSAPGPRNPPSHTLPLGHLYRSPPITHRARARQATYHTPSKD
ncbi:hypothetical protein E2C01_050637 [Portunus trituberculatus]|uniref:Uncharacterized protein n=1 Tax=Portunus trituberculatus TaxID=210409 RepID=A0A5B7GCM8_PORTR|nr:hypothetical protein [Portunus trituberculatus]